MSAPYFPWGADPSNIASSITQSLVLVCHAVFRGQTGPPGGRRVALAGNPQSPLLLHPLEETAGGDFFHSGGKHFASQNDPEDDRKH